jgi:hypothetical protein
MMVTAESFFSAWFFGHRLRIDLLSGLGKAASIVLFVYAGLRLGDLALRGSLGMAFDGSWQAWLFLFELSLSALIPATLLSFRRVRTSAAGLAICAGMTVFGMIGYRFDVCIEAFWRPEGMPYFPSWTELAVSFGIVAGAMLVFIFFVEKLKVYPQEHVGRLDSSPRGLGKKDYGPTAIASLLPDSLRGPRRYSLAAVAAAAATMALLPAGLFSGPPPLKTPVFAARTLDGRLQTRAGGHGHEISLIGVEDAAPAGAQRVPLLMIDGNRDGRLVLFPHDYHVEKVMENQKVTERETCATCHHFNLPFDKNTSCSACHRDMYISSDIFDHAFHVNKLGGNEGCTKCHQDPTEAKTRSTALDCAECHQDMMVAGSLVASPDDGMTGSVGGYMEAMHGLCITCHERKVKEDPERYGPHFADCANCHRDIDGTRFYQMKPYVVNRSMREQKSDTRTVVSR